MESRRFERMANFGRLRDWVEPAHPAIIRLEEDLLRLYQILRDKLQPRVDAAFDQASRRIGFVVTTTLPVTMEFKQGRPPDISMGADYLKGTVFEEALLPVVKEWGMAAQELKLDGSYKLYVLWHEALKLKLRSDWVEPAHFLGGIGGGLAARVRPEVMEPAHWFDPRLDIAVEDKVLIAVIDEVYADLHLVERIGGIRERLRDFAAVRPEVMEPAHFRQRFEAAEVRQLLEQIQEMIKGMG